MERDNAKFALRSLVLLVVILSALVLYSFILKPVINGYAISSRAMGIEDTIISIVQATSPPNCQSVPFTVGDNSVTLVALECLQQEIPIVG